MHNELLTGAVSFIITYLTVPAIIRVADEKKLFDLPDARKLHTKPIASLGGVGIFIGFFLAFLLFISGKHDSTFQFFFASGIVIFFLGLKDDILIISPTKKFIGQILAAAIVIHLGHIQVQGMHGFLNVGQLPESVNTALTYVTMIVIINAFNLIDGVDGLAGSLGVLTMSFFGTYFLIADMPVYAMLAFSMAGSLLAFLIFNYHPAKIFMGDSGSLLLGLINAILVIKFITVADSASDKVYMPSAVAIGFSVLIVPLLDTLRVFSIRILKGRSPFSPDRNHIHHLLLDRGFNHKYVTLSCVGLNVSLIAVAYFGRALGPTVLIFTLTTVFYCLIGTLIYFKKPVTRLVVASAFPQSEEPVVAAVPSKVVALKNEPAVAEQ
jgi:UDP-N-acetylmuramyl pentapeptide phosphotransferase/UDP-N-acetylglucosamine-1-phosphate transferase